MFIALKFCTGVCVGIVYCGCVVLCASAFSFACIVLLASFFLLSNILCAFDIAFDIDVLYSLSAAVIAVRYSRMIALRSCDIAAIYITSLYKRDLGPRAAGAGFRSMVYVYSTF